MTVLPAGLVSGRPALAPLVALLGGDAVTRLVGGAVRDALLGLPVADIDLATALPPADVMARLRDGGVKAVPTGLAHGTVTAVTADGPVEVTTLRRDVATDGRHATVAFGGDWQEDAGRRDFTINALYGEALSGAVHDYHDGLADLAARRVRFIGDSLTRIAEDHLRILRFFRFHARFGAGAPDGHAYAACRARANDLLALSRERIAAELLKLLAVPDPVPAVTAMVEGGVLAPVLPEVANLPALARLVARERAFAVPPAPVRRLAALLPTDPTVAEAVATRLRLSKAQARRLALAAARLAGAPEALAYRHGVEAACDALLLGEGDVAAVARLAGFVPPRLPVTGGALIARGLAPGPRVAQTLRMIEDAWVAAGFPNGAALDAIVDAALDGPAADRIGIGRDTERLA